MSSDGPMKGAFVMQRLLVSMGAVMVVFSLAVPVTASAQTPVASPVAGGWQVSDVREISVDGEPIALSPDGKWLAGIAEADTDEGATQVCAWDVETLTPTCALVPEPVEPFLGGAALSWAPDSSAFAFVSGSLRRLIPGNVYVLDVASGELGSLTASVGADHGQIFIGADWTDDSAQVVFGVLRGLDADSPPDDVFRVDRNGGEPARVPLPEWSEPYDILFPPVVADGAITFAVMSDSDIGGIWRVGLDGTNPRHLVTGGDVVRPFVASMSPDGRYINVVSLPGFQMARAEGTFFLLDTETTALRSLMSADGLNLVAFGPDGATGLMAREIDGENRLVTLDLATAEVTPVANSHAVDTWLKYIPVWADNDTVFLPGGEGGGTLVTLEPTS